MTKVQLESLRVEIANRLDGMVPSIFTPEMRLTLVARHPTNPDCFVVVTNDGDIREAAKLLGRPAESKTKPTVEELETILNSNDSRPVEILPDGSIREM